jgi:RimJ/RimL family protein N-acetyltransferase
MRQAASRPIETERLELLPATAELIGAALRGERDLGEALRAAVPPTWPPEYVDRDALEVTLKRLEEGPRQEGWWMYFVVLRDGGPGRVLIGSAGYKGPPSADGTVEVGYGVVHDRRRQGFASEAVRGLLRRAFALPEVRIVIGETLPELVPSIGVMQKCGFRLIGAGSEPGVIRFELTRDEYAAGIGAA